MRWLDGITDMTSVGMNLSKLRETAEHTGAWCAAVHGVGCKELDTTQRLNNNNRELYI